jgi:putative lipoic acid-binding regulatory protein
VPQEIIVLQEVDAAINEYPCKRVFTAIGVQDDDFSDSMVKCVEATLNCCVHPEAVVVKPSSGGKYASVRIGPVIVSNSDEVVAVFNGMKADNRLKWFL